MNLWPTRPCTDYAGKEADGPTKSGKYSHNRLATTQLNFCGMPGWENPPGITKDQACYNNGYFCVKWHMSGHTSGLLISCK